MGTTFIDFGEMRRLNKKLYITSDDCSEMYGKMKSILLKIDSTLPDMFSEAFECYSEIKKLNDGISETARVTSEIIRCFEETEEYLTSRVSRLNDEMLFKDNAVRIGGAGISSILPASVGGYSHGYDVTGAEMSCVSSELIKSTFVHEDWLFEKMTENKFRKGEKIK